MKYYRFLALAASMAGGLAVPALAQTAAPTPPASASTRIPDTGMKKAAPPPARHARHATHHPAKSTKPTTKQ